MNKIVHLLHVYVLLIVSVCMIASTPISVFAQIGTNQDSAGPEDYVPLAGDIPFIGQALQGDGGENIGGYITRMYQLVISLSIVLAVIMFIYHGFRYAVQDLVTVKKDAKEGLWNVFLGLALVLGAYLIMFTISPNLVRFQFGSDFSQISTPNAPATTTPSEQLNECSNLTGLQGSRTVPTSEGVYLKRLYPCAAESGSNTLITTYERVESYDALQQSDPSNENVVSERCEGMIQGAKPPGGNAVCAYRATMHRGTLAFSYNEGNLTKTGRLQFPLNGHSTLGVCTVRLNEYLSNTEMIRRDAAAQLGIEISGPITAFPSGGRCVPVPNEYDERNF